MQSGIQFNDQFADLSARLNTVLGEEDADGASIDVVLTTFNESFVFHAFEGAREACGLHAHARPKLGAGRAFSFNAQQRIAHTHADAVGFRKAGVQTGKLAPSPAKLKVDGVLRFHASKVHDIPVRAQRFVNFLCTHSIKGVQTHRYLGTMNVFDQAPFEVPRVGAGPRLAAAMLDYFLSTLAVMVAAWNGWGWSAILEQLPGLEELTELYAPMEDALVDAGMAHGVTGLLAATALMGLAYPLVEGLTGASPGKWTLGLHVGRPNGHRGNVALYLKRFAVKFIRPVLGALAALTGFSVLGWLAGPAGLVVSAGTLLLLAPHKQALHDKLAVTAVYRRCDLL